MHHAGYFCTVDPLISELIFHSKVVNLMGTLHLLRAHWSASNRPNPGSRYTHFFPVFLKIKPIEHLFIIILLLRGKQRSRLATVGWEEEKRRINQALDDDKGKE